MTEPVSALQSSATSVSSRAEVYEHSVRRLAVEVPKDLRQYAEAYRAGVEKARSAVLGDIQVLWQTTINRSRSPVDLGGGDEQARLLSDSLRNMSVLHNDDIERTDQPALQAQSRGVGDGYDLAARLLDEVVSGQFDGLLPPLEELLDFDFDEDDEFDQLEAIIDEEAEVVFAAADTQSEFGRNS